MTASSSPAQLPELPEEIILNIIAHLAPDHGDWRELRGYLQLRLVSSWFGSSFGKVAFEAIALDLHSSPSSSSNQLVQLLQINSALAGHVLHLAISDEAAFYDLVVSTIGVEAGTPAMAAFARQAIEEATLQHEQAISLTRTCINLETFQIYTNNSSLQMPAESLAWATLKRLHTVVFHGTALANYLGDFMRAGLTDISLMVSPLRHDAPSAPERIMANLETGGPLPLLVLKYLAIADANVGFSLLFLASIPVRPRYLCLRFQSFDRFGELVELLATGPSLVNTDEVTFSYVTNTSPETSLPMGFKEHAQRLEAAGPAGLR